MVIGDPNADPTTSFGEELASFCSEYYYECLDITLLPANTYTFVSDAHGTVSWLDHCITTEFLKKCITDMKVDYSISWTDHRPLYVSLSIDSLTKLATVDNITENRPWAWSPRNDHEMRKYSELMCLYLPYPDSARTMESTIEINKQYNIIITAMQLAAAAAFRRKVVKKTYKQHAGWNKEVAELYDESREALMTWHDAGNPKEGEIAQHRKTSSARFKTALILCQQRAEQHIIDNIARQLHDKNFIKFWQNTNKVCKSRASVPSNIDGETDNQKIANRFISCFTYPVPAVPLPPRPARASSLATYDDDSASVPRDARDSDKREPACVTKVTPELLHKIIRNMSSGKSPGHDGLTIEHLKTLGTPYARFYVIFLKQ
ncbi:hypothetical protein O0L34_g19384 [Tuta absoluta]|nr:hypothetical protein O0L34_g19384 [Tuta absoluta]